MTIKLPYPNNKNVWIHIRNEFTKQHWVHWCGVQKPIEIATSIFDPLYIKFSDSSQENVYFVDIKGNLTPYLQP